MLLFLLTALSSTAHAIIGGDPLDLSRSVAHVTVSISTKEVKALCSGVLIAQNAVLTSAQCVYKKDPRSLFITFGYDAAASTLYRGVTQTYVPKQFVPYEDQLPRFRNAWDIAILFFTGSLPKPYRIADLVKGDPLVTDDIVDVAGHGPEDSAGAGAGILRGCRTNVADPQFSGSEFQLRSSAGCGISVRDAGGPVYRLIGTNVFVYGLHAWGLIDSDGKPLYSVHTKIGTYYPWIQAILINP